MQTPGLRRVLIVAGSMWAIAAVAQESGPPAAAPAPNAEGTLEEVVVTGTSIRGVAPIGSNVITLDQTAIQATGAVSVSQMVNSVPAITTANSAPQGENVFSYYSPQIHSLGGSASNSTLVIMDGLRMPGGDTQYTETDPNIIPSLALERVEVLADGATTENNTNTKTSEKKNKTRRNYQ